MRVVSAAERQIGFTPPPDHSGGFFTLLRWLWQHQVHNSAT
jgi:hypothetical protein